MLLHRERQVMPFNLGVGIIRTGLLGFALMLWIGAAAQARYQGRPVPADDSSQPLSQPPAKGSHRPTRPAQTPPVAPAPSPEQHRAAPAAPPKIDTGAASKKPPAIYQQQMPGSVDPSTQAGADPKAPTLPPGKDRGRGPGIVIKIAPPLIYMDDMPGPSPTPAAAPVPTDDPSSSPSEKPRLPRVPRIDIHDIDPVAKALDNPAPAPECTVIAQDVDEAQWAVNRDIVTIKDLKSRILVARAGADLFPDDQVNKDNLRRWDIELKTLQNILALDERDYAALKRRWTDCVRADDERIFGREFMDALRKGAPPGTSAAPE
jgi:hypothetical protein